MPSPLPNGKQQFCDANGNPLAAGSVAHYIPGTTTPATTWSDSAGTIPNANPLTLDAAGMCNIWGAGSYRQVAKDSAGNTIWDQNTNGGLLGVGVSAAMVPVVSAGTTAAALALLGGTPLANSVAQFATYTAFRAATSTTAPQSLAYLQGAAALGDGGEGIFALAASDTTSSDDGGVIIVDASGRRWYRDWQNQTAKLLWWGGNAQADYSTALNAALALGLRQATAGKPGIAIEFPAQYVPFSGAITFTYPAAKAFALTLKGAGAEATTLNWATGNGLTLNMTLPTHTIHMLDMSLTTGTVNAFSAVICNQATPQSWYDQNDFTRVTFRGSDETNLGNCWTNCIYVNGLGNINFDGCLFWGHPNGATSCVGYGVSLVGNAAAAQPFGIVYNFVNCSFWELNDCIIYGNDVQGVTVEACNFTNVVTGILNPAGATNGSQLGVVNSQFNCFSNAVLIAGVMNNLQFSNNLVLIAYNNSTGVGFTSTTVYHNIIGNQFTIVGSPTGTNGVFFNGAVSFAVVTGNIFAGLITGVAIGASANHVNVQANAYNLCTNNVVNSGTNNSVGVATQ